MGMKGQKQRRPAAPAQEPDRVVESPPSICVANQAAFRSFASAAIETMADGRGAVVIDLTGTEFVDTSGLATLAAIHTRADEGRHPVRLVHPNEEIRFALVLARLDELFEIVNSAAGSA